MQYEYEGKLRQRAEHFIEALAQAGVEGAIISDSFREYSVKVAISREGRPFGPAVIYYSPKKDSFTIKAHELKDASIVPELQACWERVLSADPAVAVAQTRPGGYQIYVDGSCQDEAVGYGLVVLRDEQIVTELCGLVEEEAVQGMRQVAGELRAVYEAIAWCQANGVPEVSVFYDYEGIQKWATGEWRANTSATLAYARSATTWPVVVHWHKVDSHTGNRWNDHADRLARQAAMERQALPQKGADPLVDLQDRAAAFVGFLGQRGIEASFEGLLNSQFARVVILPKQGTFDVYNTAKRPMSNPYPHDFRESALQERIERLWQAFLTGSEGESSHGDDPLRLASYYYQILKPYHDCEFDFVDLARALSSALEQMQGRSTDVEAVRYDFRALETLFLNLKEGR